MITQATLETMPVKAYAGIGSRETPADMLALMTRLAAYLGGLGFTLRTGGAHGADSAFEQGATEVDLFLPWPGFNGRTRATRIRPLPHAYNLAATAHPAWARLTYAEHHLHARNAHQVLGADLRSPAAFVLCWTPDGAVNKTSKKTGGTGQAIRLAVMHGVPVWNLAREDHRVTWEKLL